MILGATATCAGALAGSITHACISSGGEALTHTLLSGVQLGTHLLGGALEVAGLPGAGTLVKSSGAVAASVLQAGVKAPISSIAVLSSSCTGGATVLCVHVAGIAIKGALELGCFYVDKLRNKQGGVGVWTEGLEEDGLDALEWVSDNEGRVEREDVLNRLCKSVCVRTHFPHMPSLIRRVQSNRPNRHNFSCIDGILQTRRTPKSMESAYHNFLSSNLSATAAVKKKNRQMIEDSQWVAPHSSESASGGWVLVPYPPPPPRTNEEK